MAHYFFIESTETFEENSLFADKQILVGKFPAHREIFSKSCYIKPKSDCIYHLRIDLDVCLDPNQSVHGKYNVISV